MIRAARPGLLPLLREAVLPLALFSGVAHGGTAILVGLMVAGVFPGGSGAAMLLAWAVFSLFVSLAGYRRMEDGRRHRAVSSLAVSEICLLASRVMALYPRSVDRPAIAEVFELYEQAQRSVERGDYSGAREATERGVALADGLLAEDGEPGRDGRERAKGEEECWK